MGPPTIAGGGVAPPGQGQDMAPVPIAGVSPRRGRIPTANGDGIAGCGCASQLPGKWCISSLANAIWAGGVAFC
eukprot:11173645-Lingulodinium_polyedra.AAC.1